MPLRKVSNLCRNLKILEQKVLGLASTNTLLQKDSLHTYSKRGWTDANSYLHLTNDFSTKSTTQTNTILNKPTTMTNNRPTDIAIAIKRRINAHQSRLRVFIFSHVTADRRALTSPFNWPIRFDSHEDFPKGCRKSVTNSLFQEFMHSPGQS